MKRLMRFSGIGRPAGCLWLVLAVSNFLVLGAATGLGLGAAFLFVPLTIAPIAAGLTVLLAGSSARVMAVSSALGFVYAALGVWNYFRAAAFEREHPGFVELSGGYVSMEFTLMALAIAFWSLAAALTLRRRSRVGD